MSPGVYLTDKMAIIPQIPQIQRGLPGHGRTDLVKIAIVNSCLTGNSLAFTLLI